MARLSVAERAAVEVAALADQAREELVDCWLVRFGREPPKGCGRKLLELAAAYDIQESDLLKAEIAEKQARSIKYQLTIAKLPLAKDVDDFTFDGTPINETLVRDLAAATFIANQRNAVLIGNSDPAS